MGEVEAKTIGSDQGALLCDVLAQDIPEGGMEEVRGSVVELDGAATPGVDLEADRSADANRALFHRDVVEEDVSGGLLRVGDACTQIGAGEGAGVSELTAALGVERGGIHDDHTLLSGIELIHLRSA